ncbi:MAG: hypothetical protein Q8908_09195 [Bacteroidota bacterium]|nr:hypothetical protein [Bacteroidota bacterium]
MKGFLRIVFPCLVFIFFASCGPKSNVKPASGKLQIQFVHLVNGQALVKDQMMYTNAAGNQYEIHGLKYFISDVTLHKHDGSTFMIKRVSRARYVDIDIPDSLVWHVPDDIPVASYDSVSFTFGLNEQLNKSNTFVNQPESNMAWPDVLGGGYHFLMMDGWFMNSLGVRSPFNFHLGTGQIYSGGMDTKNITGFVQNYFHVKLPASAFTISRNQTLRLKFKMNIESWFTTPVNWDFNVWSIMIMQNQDAMQAIKENGADVFSFETELVP